MQENKDQSNSEYGHFYAVVASSSYIKLPKELDQPRKGLINFENIDDNEGFK